MPIWNLTSAGGSGGGGAEGAVAGPVSSTDNAVARFNGTDGEVIQNSAVTIDDADVVSGVTQLNVDNIRIDGNTITSTNSNGNVIVDTNGSGLVQIFSSMQFVDAGLTVYSGGSGGDEKVQLAGGAGGPLFSSDTDLRWYNGTDISSGAADTGLKRLSAGVLQGTNGGAGSLTAFMLTSTVGIFQGSGTPEGAVTAGIGSIYLRTDGGVGSSFYAKEEDGGMNTGWQAK